jgi:hypothetical protein
MFFRANFGIKPLFCPFTMPLGSICEDRPNCIFMKRRESPEMGMKWRESQKSSRASPLVSPYMFNFPHKLFLLNRSIFSITSFGKVVFGPSAQGLLIIFFCNLSSLRRNELIRQGATIGGLSLPKVLR